MIAHLKGTILKITDKRIILDTGQIGYAVHITKTLLPTLTEDKKIELFIHTHITDSAQDLYGFATYDELTFFKKLITLKGIGPKVALEILATEPDQMREAITNEDTAFISKIPGIGKKTAHRLILELKGEITKPLDRSHKNISSETEDEVTEALERLGYKKTQINKTLSKLPDNLKTTEEIVTHFLKSA